MAKKATTRKKAGRAGKSVRASKTGRFATKASSRNAGRSLAQRRGSEETEEARNLRLANEHLYRAWQIIYESRHDR